LKEWLRRAWRYLAQPSLTQFDRKEMRQQMKLADEKLRIALRKLAARDSFARARGRSTDPRPRPDLRLLKIDA
jgi:hypothetical protein